MVDDKERAPAARARGPGGEVYIVEDDAELRRAILRALRGAHLTARTYDRAVDFLEDAPHLPSGCLVTDLRMPGMDGLELIRRVQAGRFPFSSILITGHADVRVAVEAMKAGACDFIEKPFTTEVLLRAVARALETSTGRPRRGRPADTGWLAELTEREREVLQGVVDGDSNKAIARRLKISPRTVESYRASLMRKSGATTLADLVRLTLITVADRTADSIGRRHVHRR